MTSQQLQASGVNAGVNTGLRCIATTAEGHVCGRAATVFDPQRGGMVCVVHSPKLSRPYEVTRSYLAKAEELLLQAAEHARKEAPVVPLPELHTVKIASLAIAARRIRCELEGGGQ
jgi:hypothetical protein